MLSRSLLVTIAILLVPGLVLGDVLEFHAYLLPDVSVTQIGEAIEVRFEVDSTAVEFNGYQVTIQYDPAIVSLLAVNEGALMTGACGSTFFVVNETDTTVTVTHVILCGPNPASLDGPGVLSTFRFAGVQEGESPLVFLSDPDSTFADGGTPINPNHPTLPRQVFLHPATVRVTGNIGVEGQSPASRLVLEQNVPNPFNPATVIGFATRAAGAVRLEIFDAAGRSVRRWSWSELPAGRHQVRWDALRTAGRGELASGIYIYRLASPTGLASRKMTLIR